MTDLWDQPIRLRSDTVRIERAGSTIFADDEGHALRVSPHVAALWPLLSVGTSPAQLTAHLRSRHPGAARVEEQVSSLVALLRNSALLDEAAVAARPRSVLTRAVQGIARTAAPAARTRIVAGVLIVVLGLAVVSAAYQLVLAPPRLDDLLARFSWVGAAIVLGVCVPAHELAHAIAATAAGLRVAEVGFTLRGVPRVSVRIAGVLSATRGQRAIVACAGPMVDALACGIAAAALRAGGGGAAVVVFLWTLLGALAATSPLIDGDGARCLEGLLEDELVRKAALGRPSRFTRPHAIARYRWAILAHVTLTAVVIGSLLR
jgi:hypothetical protein